MKGTTAGGVTEHAAGHLGDRGKWGWPVHDPSVKYADKVSPEHQQAMEAIGLAHLILARHRQHFQTLLEAERQSHTVGMILDPTLYRDMLQSKSFAQQIRLINAALAFLDVAGEIAREIIGDAGADEQKTADQS